MIDRPGESTTVLLLNLSSRAKSMDLAFPRLYSLTETSPPKRALTGHPREWGE
jgi:hypothetical protein